MTDQNPDETLTSSQKFLLRWLAAGEGNLGECRGCDLDALTVRGYVQPCRPGYVELSYAGYERMRRERWEPYNGTNY
jgi:hypothetical protein